MDSNIFYIIGFVCVGVVCYLVGRGQMAEFYDGEILWRDMELRRKSRKIKELRQILRGLDEDDDDWWRTGRDCPY